jgi:hypothetical protein
MPRWNAVPSECNIPLRISIQISQSELDLLQLAIKESGKTRSDWAKDILFMVAGIPERGVKPSGSIEGSLVPQRIKDNRTAFSRTPFASDLRERIHVECKTEDDWYLGWFKPVGATYTCSRCNMLILEGIIVIVPKAKKVRDEPLVESIDGNEAQT